MKVCFIGIGSIARRHISNLKALYRDRIVIDALRSTRRPLDAATASSIHSVYHQVGDLDAPYDAIFITNPTSAHYETLRQVKGMAKAFFIEKPVFVTGEEDVAALQLPSDAVYYVACPLRYTNVLRYVKEHIDFTKVHAVRSISSSYLPDWRPGQDYRQCYSAHKDMGGGVSIDLIHEWDYLCWLLGAPQSVKSFIRKKSQLEIDSDDLAIYLAEYPDKMVELHLDYFGRKTVRTMELYAEDDTIIVDIEHQEITWEKVGRVVDLPQERDDYQKRELEHFFDILAGRCENDNTIAEACHVLKIARGMEL